MTVEEILRGSEVQTAENDLVYAVTDQELADAAAVPRMVAAVPRALAPRIGRTATYFVPWLLKQGRDVVIATDDSEAEGDEEKTLCHHLDIRPQGNLLLISLRFYENDSYGLAMEFFDKIAYVASLAPEPRDDFYRLLERQARDERGGELTREAAEWRRELIEQRRRGESGDESLTNYRRAAETDALGLYMASVFTDVFFEDLFDDDAGFPPISADQLYERVRALERLYPVNRGYALEVIRQRPRRSLGSH